MKIKEAEKLFHGVEGYNCAQAVYKTFQKEFNIEETIIREAKKNGGGRAEKGICGALYAAQKLVPKKDFITIINSDFINEGGSLYCRDIKKCKKISCRECVMLAAKCIQDHLKK